MRTTPIGMAIEGKTRRVIAGGPAKVTTTGGKAAAWWQWQSTQPPAACERGDDGASASASAPSAKATLSAASAAALVKTPVLSCISSTVQAATMPILSMKTKSTHAARRADARNRANNRGEAERDIATG